MTENTITKHSESIPKMTHQEHAKLIQDLNPDKFLANNKEKSVDALLEGMANDRAEREPMPDIANDAFDINKDLEVVTSNGKVKLRKMVISDITIFKLTESPFYQLMMGDLIVDGDSAFSKIISSEESMCELIYQFSHNVKDVLVRVKKDKGAYHDYAVEEIGFIYNLDDLIVLVTAIMNNIAKSNNARIKFDVKEPEDHTGDEAKKKLT